MALIRGCCKIQRHQKNRAEKRQSAAVLVPTVSNVEPEIFMGQLHGQSRRELVWLAVTRRSWCPLSQAVFAPGPGIREIVGEAQLSMSGKWLTGAWHKWPACTLEMRDRAVFVVKGELELTLSLVIGRLFPEGIGHQVQGSQSKRDEDIGFKKQNRSQTRLPVLFVLGSEGLAIPCPVGCCHSHDPRDIQFRNKEGVLGSSCDAAFMVICFLILQLKEFWVSQYQRVVRNVEYGLWVDTSLAPVTYDPVEKWCPRRPRVVVANLWKSDEEVKKTQQEGSCRSKLFPSLVSWRRLVCSLLFEIVPGLGKLTEHSSRQLEDSPSSCWLLCLKGCHEAPRFDRETESLNCWKKDKFPQPCLHMSHWQSYQLGEFREL
ncbi:PREDICTED: uncharacterized protein LOC102022265 [Chinchilla lanigera]|uniref:uncharacterized protein LOC102022265 n=1 Tax=Chinchilla lanigera TaxID=34839 RepID=UPI00038EF587|nr:PREDICTED: uncharacterized protein LOC102022265 [Chinchilla lanigera]